MRNKRITKLIALCSFCAVMLIASTYAWFTGLQEVTVEPFKVEIAAADSLQLSLNGSQWSDNLTLTKEKILNAANTSITEGSLTEQYAYVGNTNNWPVNTRPGTSDEILGLVPLSTVGEMDPLTSRMKLFEKSSMTTTDGGYRLLASQVDNNKPIAEQRQKGYVAFDLFVKNFSGTKYLTGNNADTSFEEAIYLNKDSSVVTNVNNGVEASGIANSVRVAFAQVGRVSAYTSSDQANVITGITCDGYETASSTTTGVTGLCRDASIWEPNDKAHKSVALTWYNKSCRKRTDSTTYTNEACATLGTNDYLPTYTIYKEIKYTDAAKVDIYDGAEFNGYTGNTKTEVLPAAPLVKYKYFTDTDKNKEGMERDAFMSLAPNSITKIRVYVYIEGQDIDNFDYAQKGVQIDVSFGFTKQRFESSMGVEENPIEP